MKAHYTDKSPVVQRITNALMTGMGNKKADIIHLRGPGGSCLGGYHRIMVEWHIAMALNEMAPTIYRNATVVFDGSNTILYV
jgi:hypothetical protein